MTNQTIHGPPDTGARFPVVTGIAVRYRSRDPEDRGFGAYPHLRDLYAILSDGRSDPGGALCMPCATGGCERHRNILLSFDQGPGKSRVGFPQGAFTEDVILDLADLHLQSPPDAAEIFAEYGVGMIGPSTSKTKLENLKAVAHVRELYYRFCGSRRILSTLDRLANAIRTENTGGIRQGVEELTSAAKRVLFMRMVARYERFGWPTPNHLAALSARFRAQVKRLMVSARPRPKTFVWSQIEEGRPPMLKPPSKGPAEKVEDLDLLRRLRALRDNSDLRASDRRILAGALELVDAHENVSIRAIAVRAGVSFDTAKAALTRAGARLSG